MFLPNFEKYPGTFFQQKKGGGCPGEIFEKYPGTFFQQKKGGGCPGEIFEKYPGTFFIKNCEIHSFVEKLKLLGSTYFKISI